MNLKGLNEKRADLLNEVQELAKMETEKMTDEQVGNFETKSDELKGLDEKIRFEEAKEKVKEMSAKVIEDDAEREDVSKEEMTRQYELAFRGYLLGKMDSDQKETLKRANAQNTTAATGGYTIPQGFSEMLEKAMLYYMPFNESLVTIWKTVSGNDIKYPMVNDTSNKGYLLGEAADATTNATAATFADLTFKAYKFTSGMLQVSYELLEDSYFNMTQVLTDLFGQRMGRILTEYFTTGTGSSQPQGVVTGAGAGATALSTDAITRDDILNTIHSLDPAYRQNATIMFNDATFKAIRKLAFGNADDRPLYQESPIAGEPGTIEGLAFVINNEMADMGAGNVSMLVGDFKKFVVRVVGADRMVVSNERFVETDEVGMAMFKRVDSKVLDAGVDPIVKLTHPAS